MIKNMKPLILVVALASSPAFASENEATLLSRAKYNDYAQACYSFRFMTQDENLTRNNWEILFGNGDGDTFTVNTVVDDNSFIYDLGKKSCLDIKSNYPGDRKTRPLVWLAYSEADPSQLTPQRKAVAIPGHCYLTYNNDEDGRVVSLFHVKDLIPGDRVVLDEIEVLDDLRADK